jgi:hydroxyethylthiazole kinase-like uncharacterized protein yjeF
MKVFSTSVVRQLDEYTIKNEPIASIDLMERAAIGLCKKFLEIFSSPLPVYVFAGPGNNGGDAQALARMLLQKNYSVSVYLIHTGKLSADCEANKNRLIEKFPGSLHDFSTDFYPVDFKENSVIIDGLFGSGLSRPLSGIYAEAVRWINNSGKTVVSIDIPSGLAGEENKDLSQPIVKADYTFSLQFPKLSFFFSENESFVGKWEIIEIGIHPEAIRREPTDFYFLEKKDVIPFLPERKKFSHKGTYGHALIVAGSVGMAGAAVLSARAAIRSGAGLVSVHSAAANRIILQTKVPEALFESDTEDNFISELKNLQKYNALTIGPGIGVQEKTAELLYQILPSIKTSLVLDADALNILSKRKELLEKLSANTILTPHPKEFERLFGADENSYDQLLKMQQLAKDLHLVVILKGAYTRIALPNGNIYFNSTGNAGMATGGTGDVLSGMLAGLLAQNLSPEKAALLGVYLHGLAGDLALRNRSMESLIAGDVIDNIGNAFRFLREQ